MTTVWNASDSTANLSITNGGKTVTCTGSGNNGIRATNPKTSRRRGRVYFELQNLVLTNSDNLIGAARSSWTLGSTDGGVTAGVWAYGNTFSFGGVIYSGFSPNGKTICIAIDFMTYDLWVRENNGDWNRTSGQDPDRYYFGGGGHWSGFDDLVSICARLRNVGDSVTLATSAADFLYTPPVGFPAWDDAGPTETITSWDSVLGDGRRSGQITATSDFAGQHRSPILTISGEAPGESGWWMGSGNAVAGTYVRWEFVGPPRIVDAMRVLTDQGGASTETYQIQGYDPATSSWVNFGSPVALNFQGVNTFEFPNTTPVTAIQMVGVSGNSADFYWFEVNFRSTGSIYESGYRVGLISLTTTMGHSGTTDSSIDGNSQSTGMYFSGGSGQAVAGETITFGFPEAVDLKGVVITQDAYGSPTNNGTWKLQRDDGGGTWTDISTAQVWDITQGDGQNGGFFFTADTSDGTLSATYRLLGVSGTSANMTQYEYLFNLGGDAAPAELHLVGAFVDETVLSAVLTVEGGPVLLSAAFEDDATFSAAMTLFNATPSYNNPGGGGDFADRRYLIEVTSDLLYDAGSTDPNYLVDGWVQSWAPTPGQPVIGKYIQFEFKDGKAYRITELQAVDGGGTDNARWDFEAFDVTTSSWITLKSNFNWDIGAFTNPNPYTKYRLVGYSGNFASMTVDEILFKIAGPYPAPSPPFSAAFVDETEFEAIMTRTGGSLSLAMNFTDETVFNAVLFDNVIPPPIQSIVIVTGR